MNTEETAKLIYRILMNNPVITFSWGVSDFRATTRDGKDGLSFNTNGYLHQGKVEILYDPAPDAFVINLLDDSGEIKESKENIYVSELISTADGMIEYCDNYKQVVLEQYGFSQPQ